MPDVITRLDAEASGLRHLRWAREVLGSLEAHHEHDGRLRQAERDLVIEEAVKLRALVNELSTSVKVYRDFLERERTRFRGMLRVGRYLVQAAQASGDDDEQAEAEAIQGGLTEAFAAMDARERLPRQAAVRASVARLRSGLAAMDGRLGGKLGGVFVESLYPELAAGGTIVADSGDPDDDAAAAREK